MQSNSHLYDISKSIDNIENNLEDSDACFNAANTLYEQGRYTHAIKFYKKGMEILDSISVVLDISHLKLRFITDYVWGYNIGHIAALSILVKLQRFGLLSEENRIVYARKKYIEYNFYNPLYNQCYLEYWSEYINIIYLSDDEYNAFKSRVKNIQNENISCLKLRHGFVDHYSAWSLSERLWLAQELPPVLTVKEHHKSCGWRIFEQLKIPSDAWFVAIHVRESDQRINRANANADIMTYIKAIQAITERGGYVIRMGHRGMTPLPDGMSRVVDYANSEYKSDWMDVFLWANCRFFIGTASGPLSVPPTFGIPVLYTNCPAIGLAPYLPKSLFLPKLYYSNEYNRLFSFREILETGLGWTVSRLFEGIDCTIFDNTSDEIESAVIEMLQMLETNTQNEISFLQDQFNFLRLQYGDTGQMTIAQSFINKYSSLLL